MNASYASAAISKAIHEPLHVEELLIHITGSIGMATFPTDGHQPDELFTRAALAMYAAQDGGGDQCLVQQAARLGESRLLPFD